MSQKALKESIEHYDRLLACETSREIAKEGVYGASCSLCALYNPYGEDEDDNTCVGCPVYEVTKKTQCQGSPWREVSDAAEGLAFGVGDLDDFRDAANKERLFLKSLVEA